MANYASSPNYSSSKFPLRASVAGQILLDSIELFESPNIISEFGFQFFSIISSVRGYHINLSDEGKISGA